MHWPRFLTEWSEKNFVKQLLLQHDVDIKRLWKRIPQSPDGGGIGGSINVGVHVPGTSGLSAGTGQTGDTGGSVTSASAIVGYPCLAKTIGAFSVDTTAVVQIWYGKPLNESNSGKQVRACNRFANIGAEKFIWLDKDKNSGEIYVTAARC